MIRFTKNELKDIKYVIVTMSLKDDKEHKIKGLFLGYKPLVESHTQLVSNDEYFVWLHRGDNVYMLNVEHYDILTTEIKAVNSITQYSTNTQADSISRVEAIHKALAEDKRVLATGLIDIITYEITDKMQKDLGSVIEKKNASIQTPLYGHNNRSGAANYSPAYKQKEVSTSIIKRSTKYPTAAAIDRMSAKIEEIQKGKYKPPELDAIPADKEKAEDVKKSKGMSKDDLYDDYYGYGYGCGMMG